MSCSDTSNDAVVESSVAIAKFVLNIDCGMLTLDLGYPWIDEHIRIIIYLPNGFLLQVPHAKAKLWISMWCSFQFDYWNEMFISEFRRSVSNLPLILFLFTMNDLFTVHAWNGRKENLINNPTYPAYPSSLNYYSLLRLTKWFSFERWKQIHVKQTLEERRRRVFFMH